MVIEPTHNVLILTLDTVPPIRADEESDIGERGTATKDNSGPTLQITQKGNRAEGPYTHDTTTDTHHLLVSAPATRARSALPLHASSLALCDATSPPPAHGVVGAMISGKVPHINRRITPLGYLLLTPQPSISETMLRVRGCERRLLRRLCALPGALRCSRCSSALNSSVPLPGCRLPRSVEETLKQTTV